MGESYAKTKPIDYIGRGKNAIVIELYRVSSTKTHVQLHTLGSKPLRMSLHQFRIQPGP